MLQSMTDARGVVSSYAYNNRHLPTSINYNVGGDPTRNTPWTAPVSFGYDAAGNRTSMTDGLGSVSYGYDSLSAIYLGPNRQLPCCSFVSRAERLRLRAEQLH